MFSKEEDKNLRISQLHHKKKNNLNVYEKTIYIKMFVAMFGILIISLNMVTLGDGMAEDIFGNISQKNQTDVYQEENARYISKSESKSFAESNGYQLVWSDEFSGSSLNTAKWTASDNNYDKSKNVHISNSNLVLTVTRESDGKIYGANIDSRNKFKFRYGYIEYRAKLINKPGFKSTLWLNGVYNWPPEIDIVETGSKAIHMTRHCRPGSVYPDCDGNNIYNKNGILVDRYRMLSWNADFDKSKDYHIYGMEWTPTYIRWMIDGIERYRVTTGVPKEDMYIHASSCAHTSIRKCWPETIVPSEFPTSVYVDHIRVYKKEQSYADVKVISPNGGESLAIGTTKTIDWSSSGNIGQYIKIELLKNGVLNGIISQATLNDGSYSWKVPLTQTPGIDYKVKITSTANGIYSDVSNNHFAISPTSIIVASPNGGDSWKRGTTKTISWNSIGNPGSYVKIDLYKGGILNRVISQYTPNDGSYSWAIPWAQAIGTDYKIKIRSTSNSAYNDWSNNYFRIY